MVLLPASGLDLHRAVIDLRHFQFEQALDQARMGPADHDLRAAGGVLHLDYIDLDPVTFHQLFAADTLIGREQRLGVLAVGGDADADASVARVHMGDDTGEDLVLLGGELLIDQASLRFADALDNHLLGRLGRDAAELLGLHRNRHGVAGLGPLRKLLRSILVDLVSGIGDLFHDQLVHLHVDALLVLVQNDLHVVFVLGMVAAESRQHGLADLVIHIGSGNALFFFDILNGSKEFCVHNSMLSVSDSLIVLYNWKIV